MIYCVKWGSFYCLNYSSSRLTSQKFLSAAKVFQNQRLFQNRGFTVYLISVLDMTTKKCYTNVLETVKTKLILHAETNVEENVISLLNTFSVVMWSFPKFNLYYLYSHPYLPRLDSSKINWSRMFYCIQKSNFLYIIGSSPAYFGICFI